MPLSFNSSKDLHISSTGHIPILALS